MAYSWTRGAFRVFHGNRLINGTDGTGAIKTYPSRVAPPNGCPLRQWDNLGHGDQTMTGLKAEALVDIDPLVLLLGPTPLHLALWE